jgi:hypothetical protein
VGAVYCNSMAELLASWGMGRRGSDRAAEVKQAAQIRKYTRLLRKRLCHSVGKSGYSIAQS